MKLAYFDPCPADSRYAPWLSDRVVIIFFGLLTLLYGLFFVRNFSGPLAEINAGDTDQWDYMGYYVAKNLSFTPLPHINWVNDQTFYPYGTNHVFQGWAFEQNFWYAICYRFLGNGPWLNMYYLLSLFWLSSGTYLLLQKNYGPLRAMLAGFLICFFNFYALNKYPGHYAYAIIHWTVLSMLTDFLLTRQVVLRERISLRFLLVKGLLLTLCLGHDVGYILGYALSSFTLNALFVAAVIGWRLFRSPGKPAQQISQMIIRWQQEFKSHARLCIALIAAMVVLALLYVPLLIEVATQANSFVFTDRFAGGHGWVHPLRLLMPYLPGFNPANNQLGAHLHDMSEGNGAGSAGWFLLILGILGFWDTRKPIRWAYVPFLIFGVMHALYHPIQAPILQIFPWDRFNRIPSRVTIAYPVILILFALHWNGRLRPIFMAGLVMIGLIEAYSVYSFRYQLKPYYFSESFEPYMNQVKQQPGEAVLDWPFCVTGGNGIGAMDGLCPLYNRTNTLYALQRFHGKKTVGQYFGRLHKTQVEPFLKAGWPSLLNHADREEFLIANQLTTCLTDQQWRFFEQFYQYNDFAGINLCIDLLPKSCVENFYKHFGRPVATTEVPGAGRIVFIPKSAGIRKSLNPSLGQSIQFSCNCSYKL